MKIKPNIGSADRAIRLIVSIVLIILFYLGVFSEVAGVVALIVALLLTASSLISFCPLYRLFRLNSVYNKSETEK